MVITMNKPLLLFVGPSGSGQTTIAEEWPGLITSGLMIISIIMWPVLTRKYNEKKFLNLYSIR